MPHRGRAYPVTDCCQFCGRPWTPGLVSRSDEHVLAQWIRRLEENHPPEQRSFSTGFELNEASNELVQVQPEIVHRRAALLTLKTQCHVRACRLLTRWFGLGRERYALRCCVCGELGQGGEVGHGGLDGVAGAFEQRLDLPFGCGDGIG